jgi:hypothetical protein
LIDTNAFHCTVTELYTTEDLKNESFKIMTFPVPLFLAHAMELAVEDDDPVGKKQETCQNDSASLKMQHSLHVVKRNPNEGEKTYRKYDCEHARKTVNDDIEEDLKRVKAQRLRFYRSGSIWHLVHPYHTSKIV